MKRLTILITACSLLLTAYSAFAERHIHVNGQCLEAEQIAQLDQLTGKEAPDGYYWIDFNSGAWGYEGNEEIQGYLVPLSGGEEEQTGSSDRPYMDSSINGRVVSGQINGQDCTYVSVGGTTVRSCD